MILAKMQKACKKAKTIKIIKYGEQKFLTNGYAAAYIGDEAPGWNENDIAISVGLNEDSRSSYIKEREVIDRAPIDVSNLTKAAQMENSIKRSKTILIPFMAEDGKVFFVDEDRLALFDDAEPDTFYIGDISGIGSEPVLVVTCGNFPVGIIAPERLNLNKMKNFAMALLSGIRFAESEGFLDAGGQMEIEEPPEAESEEGE